MKQKQYSLTIIIHKKNTYIIDNMRICNLSYMQAILINWHAITESALAQHLFQVILITYTYIILYMEANKTKTTFGKVGCQQQWLSLQNHKKTSSWQEMLV